MRPVVSKAPSAKVNLKGMSSETKAMLLLALYNCAINVDGHCKNVVLAAVNRWIVLEGNFQKAQLAVAERIAKGEGDIMRFAPNLGEGQPKLNLFWPSKAVDEAGDESLDLTLFNSEYEQYLQLPQKNTLGQFVVSEMHRYNASVEAVRVADKYEQLQKAFLANPSDAAVNFSMVQVGDYLKRLQAVAVPRHTQRYLYLRQQLRLADIASEKAHMKYHAGTSAYAADAAQAQQVLSGMLQKLQQLSQALTVVHARLQMAKHALKPVAALQERLDGLTEARQQLDAEYQSALKGESRRAKRAGEQIKGLESAMQQSDQALKHAKKQLQEAPAMAAAHTLFDPKLAKLTAVEASDPDKAFDDTYNKDFPEDIERETSMLP